MYRLPTREQNLCACAGLQTANPPQHFDNLEASTAASFARLGLSGSLRSPYDGAPALRDLAAIGAPNQLAGQVARMNLEEARSETSHSDAERSASSIRRRSAAFSDLSSIGKSRRADKSTSAIRSHHTRRRDVVKRQAPNRPGITPAPYGQPLSGPGSEATPPPVPPPQAGSFAAQNTRKAPIEFDESINYVTKIKKTFEDKPGAYRAFLEILHAYQKEQKSIKDVYEEVSRLFKDHTELVAEFSQFLPDGTVP